ncbi:hypothetical protein ACFWDQ_17585 [Streptomyces sp. NPDC060053]|uniref:hypothetical protein n=1 Tax=Streptomyces sp. NPDC060053 TaxID=3347047 RepID=UPI0036CC29FC
MTAEANDERHMVGVALVDESIRTGWWLLPEAIGALLILRAVVRLTRVVPHLVDVVR